jgi:hypothetical protein
MCFFFFFLSQEGKNFNSSHRVAEDRLDDLMNQPQHIDKVLNKQCHIEIAKSATVEGLN